jgi:E3 ubiquitin-protein ligase RNF144
LLGLADSKKWQHCPHCRNLMEKIDGCLHMTCRCGTQSCYNCGQRWDTCHGVCPRR